MKSNCDFIEVTELRSDVNLEALKRNVEALVKKFNQMYSHEDGDKYEAVFTLTKIESAQKEQA